MDKFQRSWQLLKSSLAVMERDRKLLLFPILTFSCTIFIALLFLMPVAFRPTGHSYTSAEHWKAVASTFTVTDASAEVDPAVAGPRVNRPFNIRDIRPLAAAYFAAMYFASMFLATFFNVAFYQQIIGALNGQAVSIGGGVRFACSKWRAILMWTLFAGVVGYIIKGLEERFGLIGRLILKLLGTAWSIACVFVIPVIITDEKASNPLTVLKRSALTLKKTWGESLIGYAGVSVGSLVVLLVSVLWLGGGIAVCVALHLYWLIALVALSWVTAIILWAYVLSVASQIFRCALFLYATTGALPHPYTEEMVTLAWKRKKNEAK